MNYSKTKGTIMGKSAVPIVAAAQRLVVPKSGKDGFKQPMYVRGAHTIATSARLLKYRSCIAKEMLGKTATGRPALQRIFADVAKSCKGKA